MPEKLPDLKELMEKMDNTALKEFLKETNILGDEMSKKLMINITQQNSPLPIGQLSSRGFHNELSAMMRLHGLQRYGMLSSNMKEQNNGKVERVFSATDMGRRAYR